MPTYLLTNSGTTSSLSPTNTICYFEYSILLITETQQPRNIKVPLILHQKERRSKYLLTPKRIMALILPDIKLAVGIDLGTANIKAGIFRNGKLEIIPSSDGNLFMLAYLAFADNCRLFGAPAKYHAFRHPTSSVYNVKSFIGRKTTDPELLTELETFTTKVIDKNGQATFQATHPRAEIEVNTVEVLAMLLGQIRRNVEKYLKVFIPDAVITVPAKYSMRQRQVVKDAALIAGFNILRLLSAPSAILLGRGFEATSGT